MTRFLTCLSIACVLILASAARAQSLDLSWNTIDCGGGTVSRGVFTLSGTIGQTEAASAAMSGGGFTLVGGFWADVDNSQACRADYDGDGFVTGLDFDAFVADFEAGEPDSDFDGDGFVTGLDFDQYVLAFEAGC